jgi:hypothetical protein
VAARGARAGITFRRLRVGRKLGPHTPMSPTPPSPRPRGPAAHRVARAPRGALAFALSGLALACATGPERAAAAGGPPAARDDFATGVTLRVERDGEGGLLSFGLPLPPGAVADVRSLRVSSGGAELEARVEELLAEHGADGARTGPRAALVQLPPPPGTEAFELRVDWAGGARRLPGARVPFASPEVSVEAAETVETAARTVALRGGAPALVETARQRRTLFVAREPRLRVRYPAAFIARTRLLGRQTPAAEVAATAGPALTYLSDALRAFAGGATYDLPYAPSPDPDAVPDPTTNYEGWLYDRCATFLVAAAHSGEPRFLRHALRSCSWYASRIGPDGVFTGKQYPDLKYSHLRGLYAYYALTGDEAALAAGKAIAELWYRDPTFVAPYRAGRTRGPDKLWTERLLGTSLEGLYYGHRLTGERRYLQAVRELFDTAYRHVTGDAATLAQVNPGIPFPPQDCFIHSAAQHGEGNADQPWCSGWMTELAVDPLLRYQEQTGDPRVDEVFLRLGRFLRDVGSAWFRGNVLDDTFLAPSVCDEPDEPDRRRRLVPLYGAGIAADGTRRNYGEWEDMQHCADATALTAAALRALRRTGGFDAKPMGPFRSEGEAFVQLHVELSSCAARVFREQSRPKRNPGAWTPRELAAGLADPARFLRAEKIGYPVHVNTPQRRLSWWFNTSMEQFALLEDAGVRLRELRTGTIRGGCKAPR